MKFTLPAEAVRPYINKKIDGIVEHILEIKTLIEKMENDYQKDLDKYNNTNPIIRVLFKEKPSHPQDDLIGNIPYMHLEDAWDRHNHYCNILHGTYKVETVELTEKDIKKYNINLEEAMSNIKDFSPE